MGTWVDPCLLLTSSHLYSQALFQQCSTKKFRVAGSTRCLSLGLVCSCIVLLVLTDLFVHTAQEDNCLFSFGQNDTSQLGVVSELQPLSYRRVQDVNCTEVRAVKLLLTSSHPSEHTKWKIDQICCGHKHTVVVLSMY